MMWKISEPAAKRIGKSEDWKWPRYITYIPYMLGATSGTVAVSEDFGAPHIVREGTIRERVVSVVLSNAGETITCTELELQPM